MKPQSSSNNEYAKYASDVSWIMLRKAYIDQPLLLTDSNDWPGAMSEKLSVNCLLDVELDAVDEIFFTAVIQ